MLDLLFGINNQSFFDSYWAAVHFGSGLLLGIALLSVQSRGKNLSGRSYAVIGISLLIVWEYFEVLLRLFERLQLTVPGFLAYLPQSFFEIESTTNVISDLILGGTGLFLVYQARARVPRKS